MPHIFFILFCIDFMWAPISLNGSYKFVEVLKAAVITDGASSWLLFFNQTDSDNGWGSFPLISPYLVQGKFVIRPSSSLSSLSCALILIPYQVLQNHSRRINTPTYSLPYFLSASRSTIPRRECDIAVLRHCKPQCVYDGVCSDVCSLKYCITVVEFKMQKIAVLFYL